MGTELRKIGRYILEERLSLGAISISFRGRHEKTGEKVFVKVLHPYLVEDAGIRKRFEREAQVLMELDHPGIVKMVEYGEADATFYIVQEYLEGKNLRDVLEERGPLGISEIKKIATSVLKTLSYLHSHGVLHRDIKPSNLMLLKDGSVKLIDFGIAKPMLKTPLTIDGEFLGTPEYSPPELFRGNGPSQLTDLYSLGATLYELLTGHKPYSGKNFSELLKAILEDEPLPLRELRRDVPDELERLVTRLLEKDPAKRPQNAEEALELLIPRECRRHRKFVTVAAAVISVMLAALIIAKVELKKPEIRTSSFGQESSQRSTAHFFEQDTMKIFHTTRQSTRNIFPRHQNPARSAGIRKTEVEKITHADSSFFIVNVKPWARVVLDSIQLGVVPPILKKSIPEGRHTVKLSNPYFPERGTTMVFHGGDTVFLNIDLGNDVGFLFVRCRPWGYLFVDNKFRGQLPMLKPLVLGKGLHRITVQHPVLGSADTTVKVAEGDTVSLAFDLRKR